MIEYSQFGPGFEQVWAVVRPQSQFGVIWYETECDLSMLTRDRGRTGAVKISPATSNLGTALSSEAN